VLDPDAEVTLAERTERHDLDAGLKLSAAFGGVTASLVVTPAGAAERPARRRRRVRVVDWASIEDVDRGELSELLGVARGRLARIDDLGQLTVAAVAALRTKLGADALRGAGVVAGHALATLDTNERFERRLLDKGARRVDPRLFPATSPNAGAGHVSIFFRLTGPCFAVNGGLDGGLEALAVAADLVAAGDADRMVVVAADDAGPAARAWIEATYPEAVLARGAVAVLVGLEADSGATTEQSFVLSEPPRPAAIARAADWLGHRGLRRWLREASTDRRPASEAASEAASEFGAGREDDDVGGD
jgi:3-oxoacyl-[acyl-carrier-protein] synthase-1/3-oxoacyl-[acyl-carrier-protein] synthase II